MEPTEADGVGEAQSPSPPAAEPARPPPPTYQVASPPPPTPPPPPAVADPLSPAVLFTIGDIGVSSTFIFTPNGNAPIRGSQWIVADLSRTEEKIPSWAIVMAIVFAFACLLGLLFLLVKEKKTTGYAEVRVSSGTLVHATQVPISDPFQVMQVRQLVLQAQSIAAAA